MPFSWYTQKKELSERSTRCFHKTCIPVLWCRPHQKHHPNFWMNVGLLNCTWQDKSRNYKKSHERTGKGYQLISLYQKNSYRVTEGWYLKKNSDIQMERMGFVDLSLLLGCFLVRACVNTGRIQLQVLISCQWLNEVLPTSHPQAQW